MIDCIINIRFTNQCTALIFRAIGQIGWVNRVAGAQRRGQGTLSFTQRRIPMSAVANISRPVSSPGTRLIAAIARAVALALRRIAQAYRNRRDAAVLANLDDRMLADIGITRSDVRDALAEPLWHDPTDLLRLRALERRLGRHGISLGLHETWFAAPPLAPNEGAGYPATDRPARFTV
jgi:uncharacterized protein YjiS (DUF1127 family)